MASVLSLRNDGSVYFLDKAEWLRVFLPQIHMSKLLLSVLMIFVDTDFRGVQMDGSDPPMWFLWLQQLYY